MITKNKNGQLVNTETVTTETTVTLENIKASVDFHRSHVERHTKLLAAAEALYEEAKLADKEEAKLADKKAV